VFMTGAPQSKKITDEIMAVLNPSSALAAAV
jgi:hypothetical protein